MELKSNLVEESKHVKFNYTPLESILHHRKLKPNIHKVYLLAKPRWLTVIPPYTLWFKTYTKACS